MTGRYEWRVAMKIVNIFCFSNNYIGVSIINTSLVFYKFNIIINKIIHIILNNDFVFVFIKINKYVFVINITTVTVALLVAN